MDGFKSSDDGIAVFAGTNRVDVLDPALLRAGRFDRHIAVDLPDLRRAAWTIAQIYLKQGGSWTSDARRHGAEAGGDDAGWSMTRRA